MAANPSLKEPELVLLPVLPLGGETQRLTPKVTPRGGRSRGLRGQRTRPSVGGWELRALGHGSLCTDHREDLLKYKKRRSKTDKGSDGRHGGGEFGEGCHPPRSSEGVLVLPLLGPTLSMAAPLEASPPP